MSETSDAATPWERRPAESAAAWRAFALYRDLGPDRSLDAVSRTLSGQQGGGKRAAGRINKWSSDHDWVARCRAYDDYLEGLKLTEVERVTRDRAARWARRRSRVTEREYRLSQHLFNEAERALKGTEEPAVGDQPAVKVPPSPTELRRIASVVAQASAVARKAIEAETQERMEPNPTQDGPVNPSPILVHVEPLAESDIVRQAREELMEWQKGLGDQLAQSAGPCLTPPGSMPPGPPPVGQGL